MDFPSQPPSTTIRNKFFPQFNFFGGLLMTTLDREKTRPYRSGLSCPWGQQGLLAPRETSTTESKRFNVLFVYAGLPPSYALTTPEDHCKWLIGQGKALLLCRQQIEAFVRETSCIASHALIKLFKDPGDSAQPETSLKVFRDVTLREHRPKFVFVMDERACEFAKCDFRVPLRYDNGVSSHRNYGTTYKHLKWIRLTPMRLSFIESGEDQPTCIPIPMVSSDNIGMWRDKMREVIGKFVLSVPPLGDLGGSLELFPLSATSSVLEDILSYKGTSKYYKESQRYLWDGRISGLETEQQKTTRLNIREDTDRYLKKIQAADNEDKLFMQILSYEYVKDRFVIHGKTDQGKSMRMIVDGVRFSFFIEMDARMKRLLDNFHSVVGGLKKMGKEIPQSCDNFFTYLKDAWIVYDKKLKRPYTQDLPQPSLRFLKSKHGKRFRPYSASDLDEFLEISVESYSSMKKWASLLKRWYKSEFSSSRDPPLFNETEKPTTQFAYQFGIKTCTWVSVDTRHSHNQHLTRFLNGSSRQIAANKEHRTSICDFEVHLSNIRGLVVEDTIVNHAPLSILSYDIECIPANRVVEKGRYSKFEETSNGFPEAYTSAINVICFNVRVGTSSNYLDEKYALYLREGEPIEGVRCYSFSSERRLIAYFLKLVRMLDVDVVTGWNTDNFDTKMVLERAHYLDIHDKYPLHEINLDKEFNPTRFSKPTLTTMSSKAMGTVNNYDHGDPEEANMPMHWDAMKIVKRECNLESYSLADVAKAYLKTDTKVDLPYETMEIHSYGPPESVRRFVYYCLKDAELALLIAWKRCLFTNLLELSKVTSVNPNDYYKTGQRIKVRTYMLCNSGDCSIPKNTPYAHQEEQEKYRISDKQRPDGKHFMRMPSFLVPTPETSRIADDDDNDMELDEDEFREFQLKLLEMGASDRVDVEKEMENWYSSNAKNGITRRVLEAPFSRNHPDARKGFTSLAQKQRHHLESMMKLREDIQKDIAKLSYGGAIVIERTAAMLFCYVIILDFMSLYPTEIESGNLCFSTKVFGEELRKRKYGRLSFHDVQQSPVDRFVNLGHGRYKTGKNKISSFKVEYKENGVDVKQVTKKAELVRIKAEEEAKTDELYFVKTAFLRTIFDDREFASEQLQLKCRRFLKKDELNPVVDCIKVPVVKTPEDLDKPYFTSCREEVDSICEGYWEWIQSRCLREDCQRPTTGVVYLIKNVSFGQGEIPLTSYGLRMVRAKAKKEMKTHPIGSDMRAVKDGEQLGCKIVNNSVYGFTGAKGGKYCDLDVCGSTTANGRKSIMDMIAGYREKYGEGSEFRKLYDELKPTDGRVRQDEIYESLMKNELVPPESLTWFKDTLDRMKIRNANLVWDVIYGDTDSGFFVGEYSCNERMSMMISVRIADYLTRLYKQPKLLEEEGVANMIFFQGKKMYNMNLILPENTHNYMFKKRYVELYYSKEDQDRIFLSSNKWYIDGTVFKDEKEWNKVLGKERARRLAQSDREWLVDFFKPDWNPPAGNTTFKDAPGKNTTKGLKNKRRDASQILRTWMNRFFDMFIMEHKYYDAAAYMRNEIINFIQQKDIMERKIVMTKSLNKPKEAYDKRPGSQIGAVMQEEHKNGGSSGFVLGDRIPHVIVKDTGHTSIKWGNEVAPDTSVQFYRAYTPQLFMELGDLDIDYEHYLKSYRETLTPIMETIYPNSWREILYPTLPTMEIKRSVRMGKSSLWAKKASVYEERTCHMCGRFNEVSANHPLVFSSKNLCSACRDAPHQIKAFEEKFLAYKESVDQRHKEIMDVCYKCSGARDFQCKNTLCTSGPPGREGNQWFERQKSTKEHAQMCQLAARIEDMF